LAVRAGGVLSAINSLLLLFKISEKFLRAEMVLAGFVRVLRGMVYSHKLIYALNKVISEAGKVISSRFSLYD